MDPNTLLATGHIASWLLISGLIFPRLSLFIAAFLVPGAYPPNPLPDLVNFFGWLLVPRFLMAYYIYLDIGTANIWFWAYLIIGFGGSSSANPAMSVTASSAAPSSAVMAGPRPHGRGGGSLVTSSLY